MHACFKHLHPFTSASASASATLEHPYLGSISACSCYPEKCLSCLCCFTRGDDRPCRFSVCTFASSDFSYTTGDGGKNSASFYGEAPKGGSFFKDADAAKDTVKDVEGMFKVGIPYGR